MTVPRVLVTGAAGFLGGYVVRALAARGWSVIAQGRSAKALEPVAREAAMLLPWDFVARPEPEGWQSLGRLDAVVHCAGLSSNWGAPAAFDAANVEGTRRVMKLAATCGDPHVVHVSSSSLYFAFRDWLLAREDDPLPPPVNAYAYSKRQAEEVVRSRGGASTTIIRPRGIYGQGDTALLPRMMRAVQRGPLPLFRGGDAVIDLTHVEDVTGAILAVLDHRAATQGAIYNVSGGEPLPVRRIIALSAARVGLVPRWRHVNWPIARMAIVGLEAFHRHLRPDTEPLMTVYSAGLLAFSQTLDISALRKDTGWQPSIPFADGLERTFRGDIEALSAMATRPPKA